MWRNIGSHLKFVGFEMATEPLSPAIIVEQLGDTNQHTGNRRQHERQSVNWSAMCFIDELEKWAVTIVDASDGGFGLSGNIPLSIDSRFWICMDGIDTFPCKLIWKESARSGVQLLDQDESLTDEAANHLANLLSVLHKK